MHYTLTLHIVYTHEIAYTPQLHTLYTHGLHTLRTWTTGKERIRLVSKLFYLSNYLFISTHNFFFLVFCFCRCDKPQNNFSSTQLENGLLCLHPILSITVFRLLNIQVRTYRSSSCHTCTHRNT